MEKSLIEDATFIGFSDLHQDPMVFHLVTNVSLDLLSQVYFQFKTMLELFLGASH